jgi:hypothetical protein
LNVGDSLTHFQITDQPHSARIGLPSASGTGLFGGPTSAGNGNGSFEHGTCPNDISRLPQATELPSRLKPIGCDKGCDKAGHIDSAADTEAA